ncbi:hypothetical protein J6590_099312 [Homalodisca vitripennis]|nr:hypothetical protein J6590_099312 [Homalodisca vitripennis]
MSHSLYEVKKIVLSLLGGIPFDSVSLTRVLKCDKTCERISWLVLDLVLDCIALHQQQALDENGPIITFHFPEPNKNSESEKQDFVCCLPNPETQTSAPLYTRVSKCDKTCERISWLVLDLVLDIALHQQQALDENGPIITFNFPEPKNRTLCAVFRLRRLKPRLHSTLCSLQVLCRVRVTVWPPQTVLVEGISPAHTNDSLYEVKKIVLSLLGGIPFDSVSLTRVLKCDKTCERISWLVLDLVLDCIALHQQQALDENGPIITFHFPEPKNRTLCAVFRIRRLKPRLHSTLRSLQVLCRVRVAVWPAQTAQVEGISPAPTNGRLRCQDVRCQMLWDFAVKTARIVLFVALRQRVRRTTAVTGFCKPGAKLLAVTSGAPGSCYVLLAGTNDIAAGESENLFRDLEQYISTRIGSARVILATVPHRHDLPEHDPVNQQINLVNSYIEEVCYRYGELHLLDFNTIKRRWFTRHGMHLRAAGKRLLGELILQRSIDPS